MDPMIYVVLTFLVILSNVFSFVSCLNTKSLNFTTGVSNDVAVATWYGPATGSGSGGACGLEDDVSQAPYSSKISAGNQALFKTGKGCGACYSVSCNENPACSGQAITVTITDECPGACNNDPVHFDLSGTAFGMLAKSGQEDALRKAGRINISYQRVPCSYQNQNIMFKVDKGSNKFFLSTAVEFVNGDGDIGTWEIQPSGSSQFFPMQQVFGTTHKFNIPSGTSGPYTIKLTQSASGKSVVDQNVIPADWVAGSRYTSSVNF